VAQCLAIVLSCGRLAPCDRHHHGLPRFATRLALHRGQASQQQTARVDEPSCHARMTVSSANEPNPLSNGGSAQSVCVSFAAQPTGLQSSIPANIPASRVRVASVQRAIRAALGSQPRDRRWWQRPVATTPVAAADDRPMAALSEPGYPPRSGRAAVRNKTAKAAGGHPRPWAGLPADDRRPAKETSTKCAALGLFGPILPAALQPVEERISEDPRSVTSKSIAAVLPK
jgi:hypothetical protein